MQRGAGTNASVPGRQMSWFREMMLTREAYQDFRTFLMGAGCLEVKRNSIQQLGFCCFHPWTQMFRFCSYIGNSLIHNEKESRIS